MSSTKVTLSPKELELVNDTGWILTKNAVIAKVYTLFGQLSESYRFELEKYPNLLEDEPGFRSPKIAKGEQYQGLPWVMLDHPRCFTSTDTFAIRSFFWWGNCCSLTLQLSGSFLEKYAETVQQYFDSGNGLRKDWYIGIGKDPWQHHFDASNYQPLEEYTGDTFAALGFIKLAKKIPLHNWDALPVFFEENYHEILQMLAGVK
jgi:hypothetical protein